MITGRRTVINVNVKKENSGMSLVELIIVIAIIGILAGVSIGMMGHIHYADTKKAVETIDAELDRLRIFSMSKKEIPYLYIYQLDDGCYMREINEEIWNFDAAKFTKDGTKIAGKDVSIYMEAKDGTKVSGNKFIRIAYDRSGVIDDTNVSGNCRTNVTNIIVSGNSDYKIEFSTATGKHQISRQ